MRASRVSCVCLFSWVGCHQKEHSVAHRGIWCASDRRDSETTCPRTACWLTDGLLCCVGNSLLCSWFISYELLRESAQIMMPRDSGIIILERKMTSPGGHFQRERHCIEPEFVSRSNTSSELYSCRQLVTTLSADMFTSSVGFCRGGCETDAT